MSSRSSSPPIWRQSVEYKEIAVKCVTFIWKSTHTLELGSTKAIHPTQWKIQLACTTACRCGQQTHRTHSVATTALKWVIMKGCNPIKFHKLLRLYCRWLGQSKGTVTVVSNVHMTNSMEESPWKHCSSSAIYETPRILQRQKVHYLVCIEFNYPHSESHTSRFQASATK